MCQAWFIARLQGFAALWALQASNHVPAPAHIHGTFASDRNVTLMGP